jgi:hypothetical protein
MEDTLELLIISLNWSSHSKQCQLKSMEHVYMCVGMDKLIFFLFEGAGVWTQGFALARLLLEPCLQLFLLYFVFQTGSPIFAWALPQTSVILPLPPVKVELQVWTTTPYVTLNGPIVLQRDMQSQVTLAEGEQGERACYLCMKTYHSGAIIQTVWCWYKDWKIDEWYRIESLEKDTRIKLDLWPVILQRREKI